MKLVQIYKNGDMKEQDYKFTKKNILKILTQNCISSGNDSIKLLYTWELSNCEIICYGFYDGEPGFENKHDLPPSGVSPFIETDSSEQLLFGDIFIVKISQKKYSPITISEYSDYYNILFGGFDDCDISDTEILSSEEEIEENTSEEELEEEFSQCINSEEELEEDLTDY